MLGSFHGNAIFLCAYFAISDMSMCLVLNALKTNLLPCAIFMLLGIATLNQHHNGPLIIIFTIMWSLSSWLVKPPDHNGLYPIHSSTSSQVLPMLSKLMMFKTTLSFYITYHSLDYYLERVECTWLGKHLIINKGFRKGL